MSCQWENIATRIERLESEEKHDAKVAETTCVLLFVITPILWCVFGPIVGWCGILVSAAFIGIFSKGERSDYRGH